MSFEIPPDATTFVSRGERYFLYLGGAEMRALQVEWGLTRLRADTPEQWQAKFLQFQARMNGEDWSDKITIFRACLSRWAAAKGNGSGPVVLDDGMVVEIVDATELPGMPAKCGPAYRVNSLWERFEADMIGLREEEPAEAPKGKGARKTLSSGSSARA